MRIEKDSLGTVEVPDECYWGAQTQRSLQHFPAGEPWPPAVISAFGLLKECCAQVNHQVGWLNEKNSNAIIQAAQDVKNGNLNAHFPVRVFQTGSGTHSNMNANEVIANRANELLHPPLGTYCPIHPNDHVNMGQSSNDVFPTVMHIVIANQLNRELIPKLTALRDCFLQKSQAWSHIVKTGRTHLQDAAPLTLGQESSGWTEQLSFNLELIQSTLRKIMPIAIGSTAVGTGLNSHPDFSQKVCQQLVDYTGLPFCPAKNRFAALSSHEPLINVSATLRALAIALMKIANDIRWLGSGPITGLGELTLPENEPGSSIMPGKVNPTQCESLTQVCVQVFGNDAAIAFAGSQGNFELNVYKPVILSNLFQSIDLLSKTIPTFQDYCVNDIKVNEKNIRQQLEKNPMLATALNQHIGYEKSATIVKYALNNALSLKEAATKLGLVSETDFDKWVQPLKMTLQTQNT